MLNPVWDPSVARAAPARRHQPRRLARLRDRTARPGPAPARLPGPGRSRLGDRSSPDRVRRARRRAPRGAARVRRRAARRGRGGAARGRQRSDRALHRRRPGRAAPRAGTVHAWRARRPRPMWTRPRSNDSSPRCATTVAGSRSCAARARRCPGTASSSSGCAGCCSSSAARSTGPAGCASTAAPSTAFPRSLPADRRTAIAGRPEAVPLHMRKLRGGHGGGRWKGR